MTNQQEQYQEQLESEEEERLHHKVVPAEEWIQQGERVLYDPISKRIVDKEGDATVRVWERVVAPFPTDSSTRWLTLLPSLPEGSYGFSKLDSLLQTAPRLYVDNVGIGDSDCPSHYDYSVVDRCNQIQAHWKKHKIRRTVVVSMGCSSMTAMELLNRQTERLALGLPLRTRIEHVLFVNGGFFAHTHVPHPVNKSPIVTNTIGKAAMKAAQHSNFVMDPMLRVCFSKSYHVSKEELRQLEVVIRRHTGTNFFTSKASKYIEEHKKYADRWNIVNVYNTTRRQDISFTIVGTDDDRYEPDSFALAKEKLASCPDVRVESMPGGYKIELENPHRIAGLIDGLAMAPAFQKKRPSASIQHSAEDDSSSSLSIHHDYECKTDGKHRRSSMSSHTSSTESTSRSSMISGSSSVWDPASDMDYPLMFDEYNDQLA